MNLHFAFLAGAVKVLCIWSWRKPKRNTSWVRTALPSTVFLKSSTTTLQKSCLSKEQNTCPCSTLWLYGLSNNLVSPLPVDGRWEISWVAQNSLPEFRAWVYNGERQPLVLWMWALCRVVCGTVCVIHLYCSMPLELYCCVRERTLILVQGEEVTFPDLLCEWKCFPTKVLPLCLEKNQQVLLISKKTNNFYSLATPRNFSMRKSNLTLRDPRVFLIDLRRSCLAGKSLAQVT